jgi:3-hydroxyacyl-CoA dehydrogenase
MSTNHPVKKVAVLGAGVMGAQIAAHFANARYPVVLFDLPAKKGDKNGIVLKAIKQLGKLKPPPLGYASVVKYIEPANYDDDLERLKDVDLIIEAVAERLDIKESLYRKISSYINENAIIGSNTSGLSINELDSVLPESLRDNFCGVHFFNPPRYMHLVELIPSDKTDPAIMDSMEAFLTTQLGKGVIRAKDTPNFIANRIGVFSMLATMHYGMKHGIPLETVDALTGTLIGRPKSATYRTADVVGLDTLVHVVLTMQRALPDDPWHKYFDLPKWLHLLVEKGALGQKTRQGVYKKVGREIHVLDIETGEYRLSNPQVDPEVLEILKIRDPQEKMRRLRESSSPQAQFLWEMFREVFHYSSYHLAAIANNARDLDFAIRWGFGWAYGPLETWQMSGWKPVAEWIEADRSAGKTMADAPLPQWVFKIDGPHTPEGAYSPEEDRFVPRPDNPVYRRQLFPDALFVERFDEGETVFENDDFRLWHLGDDIAIGSFKTKKHIITDGVLAGLQEASRIAGESFKGLVIWQKDEPFSLGANLAPAVEAIKQGRIAEVEALVAQFQQTSQSLRFCTVPTVVATRGMTLGGGCEFTMHATASVNAFETYIGLVEAGVGLLPAGGGLKEIARRVAEKNENRDLYPDLEHYFKLVAMAKVAGSALEAKKWGILKPEADIIFHPHEILYVAKHKARCIHEAAYHSPPEEKKIRVAGRPAIANFEMMLANMLEGHFISEHDYEIAKRIGFVLAGGDVDADSLVSEQYLLDLERKKFMELIQMPKTLERIEYTLKTGKPLRN